MLRYAAKKGQERLREKITQALKTMEESGREQINLTDPDCALMHSVQGVI